MTLRFVVVLAAVLSAACTIDKSVWPVSRSEQITLLCIRNNPRVGMDDFQGELVSQIRTRGIPAVVYDGALPEACSHRLEYSADWSFAMAVYLSYLSIVVYRVEGDERIGDVIYDAAGGKAYIRFDKLGPTRSKLQAVIDELFPQRGS